MGRFQGRWLAVLALGLFAQMARAEEPLAVAPATHWSCWYNNDENVACIVDEAAAGVSPGATTLPQIVRQIRETPATMQGLVVLIPLFDAPTDHDRVAELVQSVMCGSGTACRADYDAMPPMRDLNAVARFADLFDPALDLEG